MIPGMNSTLRKLLLLVLLVVPASSCTDAQWRQFVEINTKVAGYVNDAMLALNIVEGIVRSVVPQADRGTVSDVWDGIQACNEALQAEADAVRASNTPLDTPAHIAAAFPRFLSAWEHLTASLHGHNLIPSGSSAPMATLHGLRTVRTPLLVRDAVAR